MPLVVGKKCSGVLLLVYGPPVQAKFNGFEMKLSSHTADGSEIPRPSTFWMYPKPLVNNGMSTTNLNWWMPDF